MALTIGELARRLRVSVRALRHYEQLGLLVPAAVDARTGYRSYTDAQLVRGVQIEQLKSVGLSLADIGSVLDDDSTSFTDALQARRRELIVQQAEQRRQVDTVDALLAHRASIGEAEIVDVPDQHVIVAHASGHPDALARTIRSLIQRIGRQTRQRDGVRCQSFSARFRLDVDEGDSEIEVAGHLDAPTATSTVLTAERQLRLEVVGATSMLPIAYDVVLAVAGERGLRPTGTVVEQYLDLAPIGRTIVALPITRERQPLSR
jgi:DNA-binding transcriptional MerR regulator